MEQLYTFGDVKRDPRARVISVAYLHLVRESEKIKLNASDDATDADWFDIKNLPELAFGKSHREIIDYAWQRLKWKFEYTNIALSMLSKSFTLSHLQKLYEVVYDSPLDKRNFRKKILSLDLLEPMDKFNREAGRPAQLYRSGTEKLKYYSHIV